MKKFVFKKGKQHWLRLISKRTKRNWRHCNNKHLEIPGSKSQYNKNNVKAKEDKKHSLCVTAPSIMLLKDFKKHKEFMDFIYELEKWSCKAHEQKAKLLIDFRKTHQIYPDACVLLIATMDNIKHLHPQLKFQIKKPIKNPSSIFDPHAIFCHLGFYKLLGLNYDTDCSSKYVQCWQYVSSYLADGEITKPLANALRDMGVNTNYIYRSYLEGMANAVEHAYIEDIKLTNENQLKKWWMLLARLDDKLVLFVCDKGHGIPKTLKHTQSDSVLRVLFEKVKGLFERNSDCLHIKASMLVRETKKELSNSETRTELSYRGKGKYDIRSFIDKTKDSELTIYSNKGVLSYKGDRGLTNAICYDNEMSIQGTILQWTIPIQDSIK